MPGSVLGADNTVVEKTKNKTKPQPGDILSRGVIDNNKKKTVSCLMDYGEKYSREEE